MVVKTFLEVFFLMYQVRSAKKALPMSEFALAHLERFAIDDELFINYADVELWNNDGGDC